MKKVIFLMMLGMTLISCASSNQSSGSKKMQKLMMAQKVGEAVQSRHFTVTVNTVLPMGGSMISPTSLYSVTLAGDSINSHLPYFGRAYDIPYGGGKGLNFEGIISGYTQDYHAKKGEYRVSLYVENEEDIYHYIFSIFDNGSTSIDVTCRKRNPISFTGHLELE